MNRNTLLYTLITIVVVVAALIVVFFLTDKTPSDIIASDTVINGDHVIEYGAKTIVKNNSKFEVTGNLTVKGAIECENGPLNIIVGGNFILENKIECQRKESDLENDEAGLGISLVLKGEVDIKEDAEIISNGNIQITDNEDDLISTKKELDEVYEEIVKDSGEGQRIGPLDDDEEVDGLDQNSISINTTKTRKFGLKPFYIIKTVEAAPSPPIVIRGRVAVRTPPLGIKRIVLIRFRNASGVTIRNFELEGPDGRDGADDNGTSCDAKGKDGENAFRFNAKAPNIIVNNFTLKLGDGGKGGDAETKKDCDPGIAKGGKGGKAGNFKMIASGKFEIKGKFLIVPGKGGDGGNAIARGKDGGPGEKGGDAKAIGGDGANNKKKLRVMGSVSGTENIEIDGLVGGKGGNAAANPGKGGDNKGCKKDGGEGGKGIAEGGKGGKASAQAGGNAVRVRNASDIGGDGGNANAHGGAGGKGGDCDPKGAGGNGGKGGDVEAKLGLGGQGSTQNGIDGAIEDQTGGNGGNGGDGCPEGQGDKGGSGNPLGKDGDPGKNICPKKDEDKVKVGGDAVIESKDDSSVAVNPDDFTFEHSIGATACPTPIGTLNIEKTGTGAADRWKLTGRKPSWLDIQTTGSVPGSVNLNFNCVLSEYATQTLNGTLTFVLINQNGNQVGSPKSIRITGYISGE